MRLNPSVPPEATLGDASHQNAFRFAALTFLGKLAPSRRAQDSLLKKQKKANIAAH